MKVEIYSDVACPWCYVGERRFARALAAFGRDDVEVVFRPYQLDPAAPADAEPIARYLERRFGPRAAGMTGAVSAAAAGEGITMDWERALAANTRDAHRLLGLALREHGPVVQRALAALLFDAHFTRGGDVSDHAQLASLAERAGLDGDRVRAFLASDEGAAGLDDELARARALGVTAVPTFVFDGQYAVSGAQPVSAFVAAMEEVRRRAAPEPDAAAGDSAACEDGACAVPAGRE